MDTITLTQHVHAPPERVFAVATDLEHAAENVPALRSLEILTDGPVGEGTRFRGTRVLLGRAYTEEMVVVEHEPPERYVVSCETNGFRLLSRFFFHPRPDGTELEVRLEAVPLSLAARLMGPLVRPILARVAKEASADIAALAAVAEGRTAHREPPASSPG